MKPLNLSAFALIAGLTLTGCSSDIVVKTDLGEKYIVKKSAVTTSEFNWDDKIKDLQEDSRMRREFYERCLGTQTSRRYQSINQSFCDGLWLKDIAETNLQIKASKEWKNKPKSLVRIRFRPIFQDLNNTKTSRDYERIYCADPDLSISDIKQIELAIGTRVASKYSSLAFEELKTKVCEKHAKF